MRTAVLSALLALPLLLLPFVPGSSGQDAHPNDDKVAFFKEPDKAALARIKNAIDVQFKELLPVGRAEGRQTCYDYPLWSVRPLRDLFAGRNSKSRDIQRWNAILTLARLDSPRGGRVLQIAAEKDNNLQVRTFACLALGLKKEPESVEILIRVVNRENARDIITAAALALGRIGGSEVEATLHEMCRRDKSGSRGAAIVALGLISSAETMAAARKALRDTKTGINWRAVLALANSAYGPRDARREELMRIYETRSNDAKVRALALLALARFSGHRGTSAILAAALSDREDEVVASAARALQHRGDPTTRPAIQKKLRAVVDGDSRLAVRLIIALADIESRNPMPDGLSYLIGLLGTHADAISIYAARSLTRIGAAWEDHPELLARAVGRMGWALRKEALGDEERDTYRRALSILDPENARDDAPDEWVSPWGDEDHVLASMDDSLHQAFLDLTNWFVEEELGVHTLTGRPETRRSLADGTTRVMKDENQPLHDLRMWLREVPYITEEQLPDRGYRE